MLWVLGSNRLKLILRNIKMMGMRITRLLLYWCLLTGSIGVQAQKKTKAQLLKDLTSTTDSIKLKANYQLAKNYLRVSLDTSEIFAETATVLAQKLR